MTHIATITRPRGSIFETSGAPVTWTSMVAFGGLGHDDPVENPWPRSVMLGTDLEDSSRGRHVAHDERLWPNIEKSPNVSGPYARRTSAVTSNKWHLAPGEGPGARECFEWWVDVIDELPMRGLIQSLLGVPFRGWRPHSIQGEFRTVNGFRSFVPIDAFRHLPEHMRWTAARDLVLYPPHSMEGTHVIMGRGRRATPVVRNLMRYFTPNNDDLGEPYGWLPIWSTIARFQLLADSLVGTGAMQSKTAAGFLSLKSSTGLEAAKASTHGSVSANVRRTMEEKAVQLKAVWDNMNATGIAIPPPGDVLEWISNTAALAGWPELWRYFDDIIAGAIEGGAQVGAVGPVGALSAVEVQERSTTKLAGLDTSGVNDHLRRGLLRPWTAFNGFAMGLGSILDLEPEPALRSIPMKILPHFRWRALDKPDLEALQAIKDLGVEDPDNKVRLVADSLIRSANGPIATESDVEDMATISLEKSSPPALAPGFTDPGLEELEEPAPALPVPPPVPRPGRR